MTSQTPDMQAVLERLENLERQNRRWKHLGLLFLLIAGSGFLLTQVPRKALSAAPTQAVQAATYDTLVVHRLELRDKAGKLRGIWTVDDKGPILGLYGDAGEVRGIWRVNDDKGTGLTLYDPAGKVRAALALPAHGPVLALNNAAEKPRAWLSLVDDSPWLTLYNTAGEPHAGLGLGSLYLLSQNHKVMANLRVDDDDSSLSLADAQHFQAVVGVTELQTTRTGESHKTSAAAVTLLGKDGKVIWRAP
jgi:hypothetical protein